MCKVISCISFKGGVGKSTTVVNLSSYISLQGKKVCVVDLDAQHNLSRHFGVEVNPDSDITIYDLLNASIAECSDKEMCTLIRKSIHKTTTVDLIPSVAKLSALETVIPAVTCRERILEFVISLLKPDYDFIFMDCHPGLDMFSLNALTASDSVIIPVEAHIMSSDGLPDVFNMIKTVKRKLNPKLNIEGILITKFQGRTNYCRTVSDLIQHEFGNEIHIYDNSIKYAIKVAEAPGYGVSIHEYAPEIEAAKSYALIAKEVMLTGSNALPSIKTLRSLYNLPYYILSFPDNDDYFMPEHNRMKSEHRDLMEHLRDKDRAYYYSNVLVPMNGITLKKFCEGS